MNSCDLRKKNKGLKKNNKSNNPNCKDVTKTTKKQEAEDNASQLSASWKNTANFAHRIKNIYDKLAQKRLQLQQYKDNLEKNNNTIKNDMKVLMILQSMGEEEEVVNNKINNVGLGGHIKNPLSQYSNIELRSIVEGFQELLYNLTLNDSKLKSKAYNLACNISSLRNFCIISNKQNKHSISVENDVDDRDQKNNEDTNSTEMFAKYINCMLCEYFGEQKQNKLDMFKCSPDHIGDLESYTMELVRAGIGSVVETEIRINSKNNRQSFISMSTDRESIEQDGIIAIPVARQYAFEGDIVRAFVLNKLHKKRSDDNEFDFLSETKTEFIRKAFVIRIIKQNEHREVVGSISFMKDTRLNSKLYYKLRPHDMRVPMVYIPKHLCTEEILNATKEEICGMIYVARILETDINGHCMGELIQPVGKVGNLQAEVKAILLHNGLKDIKPYEQKFIDMYEGPMPRPCDEDLRCREDLRKKCVFTIDPLTAKDLDDAVSVEKITDLEYEIGVHISDVSFYLEENSELDNLVKNRATSIYLVNEVIHMLPSTLCFRCSLMPGEDKFAFSVFWKWHTENEKLSAPRFTRSIINSCSQFAYEHAQKIIDNPTELLNTDDLPDILNGWTPNDIKWRVLLLHQIARKLKTKRFENGALSINNRKLRFQLDPNTEEPMAYEVEDRQEANFLIEEFMLLANQSVAKFIHDYFPDKSILRSHPPPLANYIKALKERLNNMGLEFDISSSKSIYESMQRLCREAVDPEVVEVCLSSLLTKPMARARYFCSEGKADADFWHYALCIPIYTHFTSPIRRYPDILVHRLLAAALNYCPEPKRTIDELHHLAKICNDQKLNAKNAGEESTELFFKRYLKAKKSITLKAVVTEILKHTLNVVTIETGHTISITYDKNKFLADTTNNLSFVSIIEKNSKRPPIRLQLFSTLNIKIYLENSKIHGSIVMPDIKNNIKSSQEDEFSNNNNNARSVIKNRKESCSSSKQVDDSSKPKTKEF